MANWHTADSARKQWADSPTGTELSDLLELAKDACWHYIYPEVDVIPDDVPTRFRVAQLMQARAVWQLPRTSGSADTIGIDGFQTRVYVFGYDIRQVLVPPVRGELVG